MTKEEKQKAIDALKISAPVMTATQEEFSDYLQTINQVMDWLEQQPCEDAISRILKRMWNCRGKHTTSIDKVKMEQIIRDELPPVTPQPKTEERTMFMRILIDIPEECLKNISNAFEFGEDITKRTIDIILDSITKSTPIPDNATNGQIIQTLFKPNRVDKTDDDVIVENYDFSKDWWNSPYQKGGK